MNRAKHSVLKAEVVNTHITFDTVLYNFKLLLNYKNTDIIQVI